MAAAAHLLGPTILEATSSSALKQSFHLDIALAP